MFHDPGPFKLSVNQAGPSGTRILLLTQRILRRESGLVSTCYMAAAKVVEEESGISGNMCGTTEHLNALAHESPASP
jgi:hypothetical protein